MFLSRAHQDFPTLPKTLSLLLLCIQALLSGIQMYYYLSVLVPLLTVLLHTHFLCLHHHSPHCLADWPWLTLWASSMKLFWHLPNSEPGKGPSWTVPSCPMCISVKSLFTQDCGCWGANLSPLRFLWTTSGQEVPRLAFVLLALRYVEWINQWTNSIWGDRH